MSLAEAHCKLSLRTRVLGEDAVIAVLLCENSATLKHGSYSAPLKIKDNTVTKEAIKCALMYFEDFLCCLQEHLCSLFQETQCFPVTWEMQTVCRGEMRPWMSCTRIFYSSSTPTHQEQRCISQRSKTALKGSETQVGRLEILTPNNYCS